MMNPNELSALALIHRSSFRIHHSSLAQPNTTHDVKP
jgi:hypothetical protein